MSHQIHLSDFTTQIFGARNMPAKIFVKCLHPENDHGTWYADNVTLKIKDYTFYRNSKLLQSAGNILLYPKGREARIVSIQGAIEMLNILDDDVPVFVAWGDYDKVTKSCFHEYIEKSDDDVSDDLDTE